MTEILVEVYAGLDEQKAAEVFAEINKAEPCKLIDLPQVSIYLLQCGTVCCSVLQYVALCCSVVQCVAVCCSVLQCVAEINKAEPCKRIDLPKVSIHRFMPDYFIGLFVYFGIHAYIYAPMYFSINACII